MKDVAALVLSSDDRGRVELVEGLARSGNDGVSQLLAMLDEPSWAVRRAVVVALARAGDLAVEGLLGIVLRRREHEGRLAAAVDALVATRADPVPRLIELASGREAVAILCDAVTVLGRRVASAAIPVLAMLSSHEDDNVALAAIEALERIGGADTVDALIAAVETHHFFRTIPALDALARTGDGRAVPLAEALLGEPLYAASAVRALGFTGQLSAVPPLGALLSSPNPLLVRVAATALAELRGRYETQFGDNETIRGALPKALARETAAPSSRADASRNIVNVLPGAPPAELVAIAVVLGWLGDEVAVAELVEMTMHEAPVGLAAADALRNLGPAATVQVLAAIRSGESGRRLRLLPIVGFATGIDDLIPCLDDPDADVRVHAAEALARLGNAAAVGALFRLIGDRDGRVGQAAAAAIQSLGSLETKVLALELGRSTDARTRRAALRIISYFGYREGLEVLVDAMSDGDEKVREAAIYGIPLVDAPEGIDALLAAATHPAPRTRGAIMRALGQTSKTPGVVAALRVAIADDDAWVRYYACQSLGRLAVTEACPDIVALTKDPTGQVRVAAVEALAHLDDARATLALAEAARSDDPDMRRAAYLALGIARRPESIAILCEAAAGEDPATRLVAISALAGFRGPDVVAALTRAASDPDEGVRVAAVSYLAAIDRDRP